MAPWAPCCRRTSHHRRLRRLRPGRVQREPVPHPSRLDSRDPSRLPRGRRRHRLDQQLSRLANRAGRVRSRRKDPGAERHGGAAGAAGGRRVRHLVETAVCCRRARTDDQVVDAPRRRHLRSNCATATTFRRERSWKAASICCCSRPPSTRATSRPGCSPFRALERDLDRPHSVDGLRHHRTMGHDAGRPGDGRVLRLGRPRRSRSRSV